MPLANNLFRALACLLLALGSGLSWGDEAVQQGGVRFERVSFRDIPFDVVWIDLNEARLQLFWKRPDGTPFQNFHGLRDWLATQGQDLVAATNAGIYAEDRTPLGLHVEKGAELRRLNLHKGSQSNFALKPNGVFYLDDEGAHIRTTEDYAAENVKPHLAVQSGPLLVIDNALHPKFRANSISLHLRNGIGVFSPKKIALAVSNWPVNFHTFASLFSEVLKCPNALYLDGSLSGLYAPPLKRESAGAEYVGILAVTHSRAKAGEAAGE